MTQDMKNWGGGHEQLTNKSHFSCDPGKLDRKAKFYPYKIETVQFSDMPLSTYNFQPNKQLRSCYFKHRVIPELKSTLKLQCGRRGASGETDHRLSRNHAPINGTRSDNCVNWFSTLTYQHRTSWFTVLNADLNTGRSLFMTDPVSMRCKETLSVYLCACVGFSDLWK